ncbi:alkaline phosphatase [Nocardioides pantholopis]|uniref:alkaline phosphatase n=1 Tax=Nocardioides pantholopis TaxID=2483798 RepID=UPI0013E37DF2|nr:alkaline phosphatase [Nocardioides pantholopis]
MHAPQRHTVAIGGLASLVALGTMAAAIAVPAAPQQDAGPERSAQLAGQIDPAKPRNVILIIGDGMDDSVITAARNYEYGAGGRFPALDALPFTGAMTTYGLQAGAGPDYPIAYVSDSAPTASAWSTGRKTIDGRISQGPSAASTTPGVDYETVLEKHHAAGKRVGNISTAEITDATPAAAGAHISQRGCQGPADAARSCAGEAKPAGRGSIAEQLVDNRIDVLMGGGRSRFQQATTAGPTALAYAQSRHGYRLVSDAAELDAVTSLSDGPVLGLFANGNLTPRYRPLVATAAGAGGPDTTCTPADRGTQPDLSTMMEKSIALLDNPDGFFLQAESAMIDKQEHASDICGAIGDLAELDETVAVALDYQRTHPDTLVVVTGDHAHSTQIVAGNPDDGVQRATVRTADGDPMTVAYSTNAVGSDHTGAQIRVAASGPQAANVTGVIDQTDLFHTLLGRAPSTLPGSGTPGPGTPGPGAPAPARPSASVLAGASALSTKALARRGLRVVVAAAGATTVRVRLVQRGRTLASRATRAAGGTLTLRTRKATRGPVRVVVTAIGRGGVATASDTVRVSRR